jgi:hypothetical protein
LIVVHPIRAIVELPGRRSWGEAWWTARDLCITNQPELPDPLQAIYDGFWQREFAAIINGPQTG